VHLLNEAEGLVLLVIQVREQVDLVQQGRIAQPKHGGVFHRFVLAFGHAQDHHPDVLADVELRRAHQVAHVFDDQQRDRIEVDFVRGLFDHVGSQVAVAAEGVGVHLDDRGAGDG
jgi:hypothetical protein